MRLIIFFITPVILSITLHNYKTALPCNSIPSTTRQTLLKQYTYTTQSLLNRQTKLFDILPSSSYEDLPRKMVTLFKTKCEGYTFTLWRVITGWHIPTNFLFF